eukprot:scpid66659/ scgid18754/ UV radiation resistance-associated gene protein; p63
MSSGFPPPLAVHHVELPTQQRRLRHLTNISARNLNINGCSHALLDSHFSLYLSTTLDTAIYTSETVYNSLHPEWSGFDPHTFDVKPFSHSIVVKVWCGLAGQERRVALEWHVDLDALECIGPQSCDSRAWPPNTLLFSMLNAFYKAPLLDNTSETVLVRSLKVPSLSVEKSQVLETYSMDMLMRFHRQHRHLANCNHCVEQCMNDVAKFYSENRERQQLNAQLEAVKLRVITLQRELERQQHCFGEEQEKLRSRKEALLAKTRKKESDAVVFHSNRAELLEGVERLSDRRKMCRESVRSLKLARAWIASDLLNILPIVQVSETEYTIWAVKLPPSESMQGCSANDLAVSCGFVAHALLSLSHILQVPLRHAIIFSGSQSRIRDDVPAKLSNSERELRLYPQDRVERDDYFKVAMYLLNANIVQLRQHIRLSTSDARRTLHNLKGVLDKLAIRCSRAEASLNITKSDSMPTCTFRRPLLHMRSRSHSRLAKESAGNDSHATTAATPGISSSSTSPAASDGSSAQNGQHRPLTWNNGVMPVIANSSSSGNTCTVNDVGSDVCSNGVCNEAGHTSLTGNTAAAAADMDYDQHCTATSLSVNADHNHSTARADSGPKQAGDDDVDGDDEQPSDQAVQIN